MATGGVMCGGSKSEHAWYEVLRHCDARYDSVQRISQWTVAKRALRTYRNGDNLYVRYAYFNDDRWHGNYNWLDNEWDEQNWSAVRATMHHFFLASAGEFCFASWLFHPPSILPASSNFSDKMAYFLVSSDFVSQSNTKSTLSVSVFRMAS